MCLAGVSRSTTHELRITNDGALEAMAIAASGNRFGQCGDGRAEKRTATDVPRRVAGIADVVAAAAGGSADAGHSLAVTRCGELFAWGCDRWQQLGLGSASAGAVGYTWAGGKLWQTTPRRVPALADVVDVAAGDDHSLALTRDGTVYAWGRGNDGQLGTKCFVGPPRPVAALSRARGGSRRPVAVAARGACSCALLDDGEVACVGACRRVRGALRDALLGGA